MTAAGAALRVALPLVAVAALVAVPPIAGGHAEHLAVAALLVGGAVSGLLAGLLGIGGALVTVPVLYFALPRLGVSPSALPQVVVATALTAMLPTVVVAGWAQHRHGALDRPWLARMAPGMLLGALAGALLASQLRGAVIAFAFSGQSIYFGLRLISMGATEAAAHRPGPFDRIAGKLPAMLAAPSIAAFCACAGMGGGSMVTPYLQANGLTFRRAVATASTLNLCIAAGGSLAFSVLRTPAGEAIAPAWGAAVAVGAVAAVAAPFGVAIAHRMHVSRLGLGVGLVNVFGALTVIAQAF